MSGMKRGALIIISFIMRRKWKNVDIICNLISEQCVVEVDYFRISCSLWPIYSLDAWSRTAYSWAKPFSSQADW